MTTLEKVRLSRSIVGEAEADALRRVVLQDGKKIDEPVIPKVDMPDPTVDAITALSARVAALEERSRRAESTHGTAPL